MMAILLLTESRIVAAYDFVRMRSMTLDDVRYNISLYRSGPSYLAYWDCERCGSNRELPEQGLSEMEALEKCVRQIEDHYNAVHLAKV